MIRFLVAALNSASGKTTMTCALLAALKAKGFSPCAFKCGPDYIDPMFHRSVLGVKSHNLDLYLSSQATVRSIFKQNTADCDAAVCEGAMGFYDGLGGVSTCASAWHVADTLCLPVLLVVRPKGASLTLAAQIRGLVEYAAPNSHIAGVLLNDCSEHLYQMLAPMLEHETGLPVLGFLPHLPQAEIGTRHLGLFTAAEVTNLQQKVSCLCDAALEHIDWGRLLALCTAQKQCEGQYACDSSHTEYSVRIAVAHDEAFCFAYAETLEALQAAGAQLVFFSPLHDTVLPQKIGGLYLPGGYPELYAESLSGNTLMLAAIKKAVDAGLPTAAECGGFLYLCKSLENEKGETYPMVGILPGNGYRVGRLVRFGYAEMKAKKDSILFRCGESCPVHEFHHWDCTDNGSDFTLRKTTTGLSWDGAYATDSLYAGFPHLYWAGTPMPQRFVFAAKKFMNGALERK